MKLSAEDVLYASKNSVGNIDALILGDVTGDLHTYGLVTLAEDYSNDKLLAARYEYIVNGTVNSLNLQNKTFRVSAGQAVTIKGDGREITSMTPLTLVKSNEITEINGSTIILGGNTYILSDKVQIYLKSSYTSAYSMITREELADLAEEYKASVYTDKATSAGGRVRVILLRNN